MPDAFISYRRTDKPFVRRLCDAMIDNGRDIWIDWEDIAPTTDWLEEIYRGIESADNFIFVITPDSLVSEVCNMEVDHALKNNKRLVPLLYRPVDEEALERRLAMLSYGEMALDNWRTIKHVNWIFFDDPETFDESFLKLVDALETDIGYVKEHTRLLVKAHEWESNNRNTSFLLRGVELNTAENWMANSSGKVPDPTPLQGEYILESRRNAAARQRLLFAIAFVGFVAMFFLAVFSLLQFNVARENEAEANDNATRAFESQLTAEFNAEEAQDARQAAESQLRQTRHTQSLFLADLARQQLEDGRFQTALLLSIASLNYFEDNIFNIESGTVLSDSLVASVRDLSDLEHDGLVNDARWSLDGMRVLSIADDEVYIWDRDTSALITLPHDDTVGGARWNHLNPGQVLTWSGTTLQVWDIALQRVLLTMPHQADILGASWDSGFAEVLTWDSDGTIRVWGVAELLAALEAPSEDAADPGITEISIEPLYVMRHSAAVNGAVWDSLETTIMSWGADGIVNLWLTSPDLSEAQRRKFFLSMDAGSDIIGAVWNEDETRILAWNDEGSISIYTESGIRVFSVSVEDNIREMLWQPGSQYVLSISASAEAQIWSVRNNTEQFVLQHPGFINGAQWRSDGRALLTWGQDGTVRIWELPEVAISLSQVLVPTLVMTHDSDVNGATWSDDESTIISWSDDDTVRLWDAETGESLVSLPHENNVEGIDLVSDETFMLSWSNDERLREGTIRLWDFRTSPDVRILAHDGELEGAAWHPDETHILTWGTDGNAWIYFDDREAPDGGDLDVPVFGLTHLQPVEEAFWRSDGTQIMTYGNAARGCEENCVNAVTIWDSATQEIIRMEVLTDDIEYAAWSPNEQYVAIVTETLAIHVFDSTDPVSETAVFTDPDGVDIEDVIWSVDNQRLLVINDDDRIYTLNVVTGEIAVSVLHDRVRDAAWGPDNRRFATWGNDDTARVWDASTGDALFVATHEGNVQTLTWGDDGNQILTGSSDNTVRIWDLDTGLMSFIREMPTVVDLVQRGHDKDRILVVSSDSAFCSRECQFYAYLLDADTAQPVYIWSHETSVAGAFWREDENVIITVTSGGVIRLWDTQTGEGRLAVRHDPNDEVQIIDVIFSETGMHLLTAGRDNTTRIWTVNIPALLERAEDRALRDLTNEEREDFFLPTLTPSVTPTATPTTNPSLYTATPTPTPTVTQLPTLTPSQIPDDASSLPTPTAEISQSE